VAELPSIRLAAQLNVLIGTAAGSAVGGHRAGGASAASGAVDGAPVRRRTEGATGHPAGGNLAERIVGADVAHHVVDPDDVLGLDSYGAAPLRDALPRLMTVERERWVLALPAPGALGALRGPVAVNRAALEAGEAVVASAAGLALVPYRVGPAVQWRVYQAERPFLPTSPSDAERELNEAVLAAAATLTRLDVAAGPRPFVASLDLPTPYFGRQAGAADRAATLLAACTLAMRSDGASLSSYEATMRGRELQTVAVAARGVLSATITWLCPPASP
jgi:hypothetical protein